MTSTQGRLPVGRGGVMRNLEHSLLCVWLGVIFLFVCVLNARGIAKWIGNKIADLLGGSPRW